MVEQADKKIFSYLLKGPAEFNATLRLIELGILTEACHFDFKDLAKIIKEYYEKYQVPPTYEVLKNELVSSEEDLELLFILENEEVEEIELKFYLDKIRSRYNAYLAKKLSEAAIVTDSFDPEEFNSELDRIRTKIERLHKNAVFIEGDLSESTDERYGRYLYTKSNPKEIAGVFSGYKELDDYTWGIKNSELMVVSGASSSGKSLFMLNIALNAWKGSNDPLNLDKPIINDGKNILFFSLEMSKQQLEQRIDANLANVRINGIMRGLLSEGELDRYETVLKFCSKYNKKFYICDMPRGTTTREIALRYDTIISEFKPDLVCVDYLQIMSPNVAQNQDWLSVGQTAADLHEFCRAKNIPVITAAQKKAKDKKSKAQDPDLEDLGRSLMLAQNSNIILVINDRKDEQILSNMELIIAKNRDGAKGKITLLKEFENARISSMPDDWVGDYGEENAV